jgi:Protein of unknown function (DUF3800)
VRLLFLDESGRIGQDGLFALGGVTVHEADWRDLRGRWLAPLVAHGWDPANEVKWHGIRNGYVPPELADAVVEALARAPLKAYVTLLDLEAGVELPEFFGTPELTYGTALMFVSERFHHLLEAEDELGLIVADSRHREDDQSLRRYFGALTETGTPYMKLDRIVEGLFLGPSHLSIGLQCADLVVSITAAAERGNGLARGYLRKLLPRFATHPATGELDGVGLKRFPEVPRERPPHKLF